jgi:hypothetical protein
MSQEAFLLGMGAAGRLLLFLRHDED